LEFFTALLTKRTEKRSREPLCDLSLREKHSSLLQNETDNRLFSVTTKEPCPYDNLPYEVTAAGTGACQTWSQLGWRDLQRGQGDTELQCAAMCHKANSEGGNCKQFFIKKDVCAMTDGTCQVGAGDFAVYDFQTEIVPAPVRAPTALTSEPSTSTSEPAQPTTSTPEPATAGDSLLPGNFVCLGRKFVDTQVQSRDECSQLVKMNPLCGSVYTYNQGSGDCHCQPAAGTNPSCTKVTIVETGTYQIN